MSSSDAVDAAFTKRLPKIELHAHLSGSVSRECLHHLWTERMESSKSARVPFILPDPLIAMPANKTDYDIKTFFPLFSNYIHHLIPTISALTFATHTTLTEFQNVGVVYAELRTTPRALPGDEHGKDGGKKEDYIMAVLNCFEPSMENRHEGVTPKLILSIDRKDSPETAMETVDMAIKYKEKGVVGVDLCGDPRVKPDGEVKVFEDAFKKAKKAGLKVTLHFGETERSGNRQETEVLLEWQPDRLGHICYMDEETRKDVVKRKIGLELCLSCNVLAKLIKGGFEEHHFGEWRGKGCPIALCTDDVGVFGSALDNEYLLASQHFKLGRKDLLDLCEESVGIIFSNDEEKEKIKRALTEFKTQEKLQI